MCPTCAQRAVAPRPCSLFLFVVACSLLLVPCYLLLVRCYLNRVFALIPDQLELGARILRLYRKRQALHRFGAVAALHDYAAELELGRVDGVELASVLADDELEAAGPWQRVDRVIA